MSSNNLFTVKVTQAYKATLGTTSVLQAIFIQIVGMESSFVLIFKPKSAH